jgi:hypothetical protein
MANLWATDSDSESSKNEPTEHPPTPVELCGKTQEVFEHLQKRTPIHIESLYHTWRDTQKTKHQSTWVDKNGVFGDAGRLITMLQSSAEAILGVADDELENDFDDERIRNVARNLASKSKEYIYEVRFVWSMLKDRKNERRAPSDRMYRDLGMLMQLEDKEAQEIHRRLRDMARKGELVAPKKKWDRYFKQEPEEGWEYKFPYPARGDTATSAPTSSQGPRHKAVMRPRNQFPNGFTNLSLSENSVPITKEKSGNEEQERLGAEKANTTETGFRPHDGDWQCRCGFWNRSWWGFCRNDRCVFRGTKGEDSVAIHSWQSIEWGCS